MNIVAQINQYIQCLSQAKRADIEILHKRILQLFPNSKLWFLDGKNAQGKVISNPNIGYGLHTKINADGKLKDFYKVGISSNTTGISVYLMSIDDKLYLPITYGNNIGKASVTSYCIKFKNLKDINFDILELAIQEGLKH